MKALVMSGGGAKGAFQWGALQHLIGDLGRDYDIIAGVSVGALNAAVLGQVPLGDLRPGLERLSKFWASVTGNETVWKHWFIPYLPAVLWADSVYNTAPLEKLVRDNVDDELLKNSGRILRFGCVDYITGRYLDGTEETPEAWRWIVGSAAFPGFFLPVRTPTGEVLIDGGVRRVTPITSAIRAGATEIDVIVGSAKGTSQGDASEDLLGFKFNALDVAFRAIELQGSELYERDLEVCMLHNRLIEAGCGEEGKRPIKITIIRPDGPLAADGDSLQFDPSQIELMRAEGFRVAQRDVKE